MNLFSAAMRGGGSGSSRATTSSVSSASPASAHTPQKLAPSSALGGQREREASPPAASVGHSAAQNRESSPPAASVSQNEATAETVVSRGRGRPRNLVSLVDNSDNARQDDNRCVVVFAWCVCVCLMVFDYPWCCCRCGFVCFVCMTTITGGHFCIYGHRRPGRVPCAHRGP